VKDEREASVLLFFALCKQQVSQKLARNLTKPWKIVANARRTRNARENGDA
jgi:hypothetical protein